MRLLERTTRLLAILGFAWLASTFALRFGSGGLWRGLGAAHAVTGDTSKSQPYDLTELVAVNETLQKIKTKYVDPSRVKPRAMFLSALNQVQREVAQVIVLHDPNSPSVRVRVDTEEQEFRVDNVQGPWDVSARLREVFTFLQKHLQGTDVKLEEIEYAACNGMLQTLDPHSVFMSPEAFREMNMSTTGHFGGLGIVIAIRDQLLTVVRPMPDTPAAKSGLKRLDRIIRINNEATTTMPLDDAVQRLRGDPGSEVTIWVQRDGKDGWNGARPFKLVREVIQIKSIDYRELQPGVGYVRLRQFQASSDSSSADELKEALTEMKKRAPLQGLVLDLRDNPGGLLDQAVKVADTFLSHGVIVATVGSTEGRDEKVAQRAGTEPEYPIIVLVDGSSASASEIVTGALKNHDRAVVVGQTTFGKGSVQLVFSRVAGGAALKLTVQQYLTPGDISIQGVGVTPDIELDPMTADPLEMDLYGSEHRFSERELERSLTHDAVRNNDRPWTTLRFRLPESERDELRELGSVRDEFYLDFPIRFARDLVTKLAPGKLRAEQLEGARDFIAKEQANQLQAISQDLKQIGIDWAEQPAGYRPKLTEDDLEVHVETDRPNNTVTAGEPMTLKVSVTNKGSMPVYQLRAVTKSDSGYYDERELLFGRVDPGKTVVAQVPFGICRIEGRKFGSSEPLPSNAQRSCRLPKDAITREDIVKVRFSSEGGPVPREVEIRPTLKSLEQPTFAYTYQVVDNLAGNGDGQISRGESVTVYLDVTNIGKGKSFETEALLRNLSGDGLLIHAGRFDISNLAPGDRKQLAFTFDVLDSLTDNMAEIELSVVDQDLRVVASEKVQIPVVKGGSFMNPAQGQVRVKQHIAVLGQPVPSAAAVGFLAVGTTTKRLATFGPYTKVDLGAARFGFVESAALEDSPTPTSDLHFEPLMSHSPPLLDVSSASLSTRGDKIKIQGVAHDGDQVLDAYMFVGNQKVFYQSNRKGSDHTSMPLDLEVNLNPGINIITVVARENEDVLTSHVLVVRRDGPNGESMPTPKGQSFAEDWAFSPGGE
jgi:carboxyl-terminal processing protease